MQHQSHKLVSIQQLDHVAYQMLWYSENVCLILLLNNTTIYWTIMTPNFIPNINLSFKSLIGIASNSTSNYCETSYITTLFLK